MMAITIRMSEEQEKLLELTMELTGEKTKSKAILYLVENSKELIRNSNNFKKIKELEKEIKEKEKMMAKIKAG
jgi:hypothetical protein